MCGTPIGNLDDTTPRLQRTLEKATIVACEDTRHTRKLLTHFGIRANELVSYNEANEGRKSPDLVARIVGGATVALVSDAGMPGLSDPGYRLVRAAVDAGIERRSPLVVINDHTEVSRIGEVVARVARGERVAVVTDAGMPGVSDPGERLVRAIAAEGLAVEIVPGPSAAIAALVVSGLPTGRFVFEGFLPRKSGERRRHIEELIPEKRTLVFYESPHRSSEALVDLAEVLGPREAALARELTKMHEEVLRGTLSELVELLRERPPRGEITLVVQGAVGAGKEKVEPAELARITRALMDSGVERKEAMQEVARQKGVSKRAVFDALLEDD